jgi:ribose 5-phosphate isomerase B
MRVAFGCDHAGFEEPKPYYKPELVLFLTGLGHEVIDCGTDGPGAVDYPDYAQCVSESILAGNADYGLLLCGTGIGMGMAANKYEGIRAAVCTNLEMATLSREHNNANVLCIGRRILSLDECEAIIDAWLNTPFSGAERHVRRVEKIG